jgi:hypothetical protein
VVRYGPFPFKWERVGIALAVTVVALGLGFAGTLHNELHCANDTCSLDRHGPFGTKSTTFPRRAIHDVRVAKQSGKSVSYSLALVDGRGAETLFARTSKSSDLDPLLTRARTYFVDGRSEDLQIVEPVPYHLLAIGCALAVVAALFVRSGIRGRFSRTLRVEASRIVMRGRSIEVPVPLTAIEVQTGTIHDAWKSRGQVDEVGGRVVLVGDRERVAITEEILPGTKVHEKLAMELREILGLAPKSIPREARSSSSWTLPIGGIVFVFVAIVASVVGNLALRAGKRVSEGTLEVTCTNRCKFQGMECMPGGSWGSTLPPGDYSFEVYDATSPTQWTTRTVTIKKGETTQFACTPR